jgi:type I pantothenate kinase
MDQHVCDSLSPYLTFTVEEWGKLRADTPLTLDENDLARLQGLNERVSMDEVVKVYLPLSRLLSFYVAGVQDLFHDVQRFIGRSGQRKMPYIVGLAGSVAVGKSTTARILQALLARWPGHPKVDLVPTDGFLFPNAVLEREELMERKGFPESYDVAALLRFLTDIKAGKRNVTAPVYSHFFYDVLPDQTIEVDQPDVLIIEGLNVLAPGRLPRDGKAIPFVSDFFDFSIYLDADETVIERWYVERFFQLRATAFRDPASYFHRYSQVSDEEADAIARGIWRRINLANLQENVLPTRQRADLILSKREDHAIANVALRKL